MHHTHKKREYRNWVRSSDLLTFQVTVKETDLLISATHNLEKESLKAIHYYRDQLDKYIRKHPEFKNSFIPTGIEENASSLIKTMGSAGKLANTGPFAAVAGAMAEFIGKDLLKYSDQIIVENGGDIFICSKTHRVLGIYAGNSPLTGKLGIKIPAYLSPVGICTSSGTVGHSISFGKADAAIIISKSTALADSVATATANLIKTKEDLEKAISFAQNIKGVIGAITIINENIAAWGKDIEIVRT